MTTTIARKKTAAGAKKKSASTRTKAGAPPRLPGGEANVIDASPGDTTGASNANGAPDVADQAAEAARAAQAKRDAEVARVADEALALARKTPLARPSIEALAAKYDVAILEHCATTAFVKAGSHAATVLAFALAAKGARLSSTFCAELLGEVESFDHVGPLLLVAEDILEATAKFVESGRGTWEREIVALLLAGERRGDAKAPDAVVRRARFLVRHDIGPDNVLFLGGAVQRLGDPLLSSLGAAHVNKARRNKRLVDDELALLLRAPLEVLAETAQRVTAGYTVKRESPSVGRNDPCPCGSGKKYKKCHAGETATVDAWEPTPLDPTRLGVEQARNLRASDLLSLDPTRLPVAAQEHAFQRAVDYRLWPAVFAILDATKGSLGPRKHHALVLDALSVALEAKEADVAERLLAYLPSDATVQDRFEIACIRGEDTLARIEAEALASIREDAEGARGILLASTLLRQFPALGIYVGRGVLHEGRIRDSEAILQRIEDARDRLLVSPFEPWWDVYDTMVDEDGSRRDQKKEDAKREKLKDDLRRARAASRKAATEAAKLQSRVDELDASVAEPAPIRGEAPKAVAPTPDVTEERRRLKAKIDELQRIIGEGQDERRELRKQLSERDDDGVGPRSKERAEAPVSRETELDDVDVPDEGDDVAAPRGVSVPRFAERAAKALADLAPAYAEGVLQTVASLAAGKPNAWGGVKQLTKVRGVFSARAGIHHRVLFRLEGGGLEVIEVIHRKDLEQVLSRMGARP